jgi:putative transcriptional regulator
MQYILYIQEDINYNMQYRTLNKEEDRGPERRNGMAGKNLKMKAARAGMDLSQEELAELVGVTRQTIGMIEAGKYNPTLNLCLAICRVLHKTLDELFWEE